MIEKTIRVIKRPCLAGGDEYVVQEYRTRRRGPLLILDWLDLYTTMDERGAIVYARRLTEEPEVIWSSAS